jgi:hypothetical protein
MKSSATTPLRWGRSLLLGLLAAGGLAVASPVWMLAQMGTPVPFSFLWGTIVLPVLLAALFIAKTSSIPGAILCGFLFAVPISGFCAVLPSLDSNVKHYFSREIWSYALATIPVSAVVMGCAAFVRQSVQGSRSVTRGAEPDASPNGGPAEPQDNSGAGGGPPSVS